MSDDFSIDKVVQANQTVDRYHATLRYGSLVRYEIDIDESAQYQHVLYGIGHVFPQAEAFWYDNQGLGRKISWERWLALQTQPAPWTLRETLQMVATLPIALVNKGQTDWEVAFKLDNLPLLENPQEYFAGLFGYFRGEDERAFVDKLVALSSGLEASLVVKIALDSFLIRLVRIAVTVQGRVTEVEATFTPVSTPLPPYPHAVPPEHVPALPLEFIAMPMPSIGGWSEHRHCIIAQQAIKLIKEKDNDNIESPKFYREIYNEKWASIEYTNLSGVPQWKDYHPIVIGAYYEDAKEQFPQTPYLDWIDEDERFKNTPNFRQGEWWRSFHHFGGYNQGLADRWYFTLLDWFFTHVPDLEVGNRFYSARDWGYGLERVDVLHNLLTFTEAISQYNTYTYEGKKKAYVMLGHVVHLLVDQGQPDHSRLEDHAGSGYTEGGVYDEYKICTIRATALALEAGYVCGPICFAATLLASMIVCTQSIDPNEVGFEFLTSKQPLPANILDVARKTYDDVARKTYDGFFAEMSDRAIEAADKYKLHSPLGLSGLWLPPPLNLAPLPPLDPIIHQFNEAECQPYLDLYNEVLPQMIGMAAGLIRHFFEIVNHPPYVQRVAVVKGVEGRSPVGFGQLDAEAAEGWISSPTRYAAEWQEEAAEVHRRRKVVTSNETVSPAHYAYVFLQFGPNLPPQGCKTVKDLVVEVSGTAANGMSVTDVVNMTEVPDDTAGGNYYWGSFQPPNPTSAPYSLTLSVSANDKTAHLKEVSVNDETLQRPDSGAELDADPSRMAQVDVLDPPLYPLVDYMPGTDRNHVFKVGPMIAVDELEPNDTFPTATRLDLQIPVVYPTLTLHDQADIDRFLISFPTSPFDLGATIEWTHDLGGGLRLHYMPPMVSIAVEELYGAALTVELCKSDTVTPYPVTPPEAARHDIAIVAPTGVFTDRRFYLTVSNRRFESQGPLIYLLEGTYWQAGFVLTGRLLYDYALQLPIPPEQNGYELIGYPVERIVYRDPQRLLAHFAQYQQRYLRLLRPSGDREAQRLDAVVRAGLGRVANAAGLYTEAVRELSQAATTFRRLENREEGPIQHLLQLLYIKLGRQREAEIASRRLKELGSVSPYPEARK